MKKFFSAFLLMAAMAFSVSTFVSCNDLTQEMEDVKAQATQNAATISALQGQIDALETALATAQATANEAKTAAAAAQATGDTAKKLAEEAKAAAAQAEAKAIAEAKKEVEALKAIYEAKVKEIETALAGKASKEELAAEIKKLDDAFKKAVELVNAEIRGINETLATLATKKELADEVADLVAADKDLKVQADALKLYAEATQADVDSALLVIADIQADLAELWQATMGDDMNSLKTVIGQQANIIEDLLAADKDILNKIEVEVMGFVNLNTTQIASAMEAIDQLNKEMDAVEARVKKLEDGIAALTPRVEDLEKGVSAINTEISTLKTLIKDLLRSITFAPKTIIDGVEAIEFANFEYKPMEKIDDEFNENPKGYNTSVSEAAYAYYHFNPSSFVLDKANYTYRDRAVEVKDREDRAVEVKSGSNLVTIEAGPKAMDDKTVEFKLRRDNTTKATKDNMIALEATITADGNVVRSPYVQVVDSYDYQADLYVADAETLTHYYLTAQEAADSEDAMYKMVWDGSLDFEPLAVACLHDGETHHAWDVEEKYGFTFRYSVAPSEYFAGEKEGETWTEQQRVLNAPVANENGVNALFTAKHNKESIGRTPIVLVEILDQNGKIVRYGYAKVEIVVLPEEDVERGLTIAKTITYDCTASEYIGNVAQEKATIQTPFDETWFQNNLYKTLTDGYNTVGMSHSEFWNMYYWDEAATTVTKNGDPWDMSAPYIAEGSTMNGTQTKIVAWKFDHSEFGPIGKGASFVGTVVLKNKVVNSEYPEKITLSIAFDVVLPAVTFEAKKDVEYWNKNDLFVINPTIPDSPEATSEYFYYDQNIYEAYVGQKVAVKTAAKTQCYTHGYRLVKVYDAVTLKDVIDPTTLSNYFDTENFFFDELPAAAEKSLNEGTLMAKFDYVVKFANDDEVTIDQLLATIVKPVYMNLNIDPQLELTDAQDDGDQVEINYKGLFTDWRGKVISKGEDVYLPVTYYQWVLDCPGNHGKYVYTEAPAVATITTTVKVPANVPTYTASVTARLIADWKGFNGENDNRYPWPTTITDTFTGTPQLTKADAINSLKDVLNKANVEVGTNGYNGISVEDYALEWAYDLETAEFTPGTTTKETEITIVTKTEYKAAKYVWEPIACGTEYPEYDGEYVGQKAGCWVWTAKEHNAWTENVGAQYWDFYGMAWCFDLDLENVKTNLEYNGFKLPEAAKLEQVGTTLKYYNVHSPVHTDYEIYVPVTMAYKFGTLEGTLTITVKSILPQE